MGMQHLNASKPPAICYNKSEPLRASHVGNSSGKHSEIEVGIWFGGDRPCLGP